jgi:hypothetical protein
MNYKIVETSEKNCLVYNVVENMTDQIVRSFSVHKEAKKLLRHLNLGGGFDGWTPTFFLKKIKISTN